MSKYKDLYMDIAETAASHSKAKRLKVGCVLVKDDIIITIGMNGTYKGCYTNECEGPDGLTTENVIHAEGNALDKATRVGRSTKGATAYVTHSPCEHCARRLIGADISSVVYKERYRCDKGLSLLTRAGVQVTQYGE